MPDARAGPPYGPSGLRVSTTRHGARVKKSSPGVGVGVGVFVGVGVGVVAIGVGVDVGVLVAVGV